MGKALTPAVEAPLDTVCFVVSVPNHPHWRAAVNGALLSLTRESYWADNGEGVTPEEAASRFWDMFVEYRKSEGACVLGQIIWTIAEPENDTLWLKMDGGTYNEEDYEKFFAVCPASWKSGSTFTLPNMGERTITGTGIGPSGSNRTLADEYGNASKHITVANLPPHTHTVPKNIDTAAEPCVTPPACVGGSSVIPDPIPQYTGSTGGGEPLEILPPALAAYCYIRVR